MLVYLQGQIERITYTNEENGFTIAKVRVPGRQDLVCVVGNLMAPMPGEVIKMQGEWANHPKFGEQFKIVFYKSMVPASVHGIQKYLGSGLIKGTRPVMAKRIVKKFGKDTLDVIGADVEKLSQVEGIGTKRIEMIKKAWADQKEIREVMVFLQSHGVSSGYATKIFKQYGNESIKVVKENPYRLATDIFGIGFITADKIAEKLGFGKESELRAKAGILYVLHELSDEGHVFYPYELFVGKSNEIIQIDCETIVKAIRTIALDKRIVIEDLNEDLENLQENHKAVYLPKPHLSETSIAPSAHGPHQCPKIDQSIP
jgi:exodeoxyribonuclease V alpha subunit